MKRWMSHCLRPLPVLSGMLDACRDWRKWLTGLDDIPTYGRTGLVTSNCDWLALCRREDVPVECAAIYGDLGEPGITSAPGDVMRLVKEYMSDPAWSQRPFCFLRAGASNLLPNPEGPLEWEPRREHDDSAVQAMRRLCDKILTKPCCDIHGRIHGETAGAIPRPFTFEAFHPCEFSLGA